MTYFAEKLKQRVLYSHIRPEESGLPLSLYLSRKFSRFSEDEWIVQIQNGLVRLNHEKVPPETRVRTHDRVDYFPPETEEPPADLNYKVLYEDSHLIVFDKPGNLCVHPTGPFFRNTLWHAAGKEFGELHFINRLDKETSGLLTAARTPEIAAAMNNHNIRIQKEYAVLVFGVFPESFHAKGLLVPDSGRAVPTKFKWIPGDAVSEADVLADTEFFCAAKPFPGVSLLRAVLHTGHRHQIRATLCSLGFPVVGDKLYGLDERIFLKIKEKNITTENLQTLGGTRQALHSMRLEFKHPVSGKTLCFVSPFKYQFLHASMTDVVEYPGTNGIK